MTITIATTATAEDFGDLTVGRHDAGGASDGYRGVFAGGTTGTRQTVIEYVVVETTGDATTFGSLAAATSGCSGAASATYGFYVGGLSLIHI